VLAEKFFLQRHSRPSRKHRILRGQDRLIEKRDDRKRRQFRIFAGVSSARGILCRHTDQIFCVGAEGIRIGNSLQIEAHPHDRCKQFLKAQRQIRPAPWALFWTPLFTLRYDRLIQR